MSGLIHSLLLSAVFGGVLILCQCFERWLERARERRAALDLKASMNKYHADCRRTGHYDY